MKRPKFLEEKPIVLKVDMSSELEARTLPQLAKQLLWIDENIPNSSRNVKIKAAYNPALGDWSAHEITITWKEERANQEALDE